MGKITKLCSGVSYRNFFLSFARVCPGYDKLNFWLNRKHPTHKRSDSRSMIRKFSFTDRLADRMFDFKRLKVELKGEREKKRKGEGGEQFSKKK